MINLAVSLIFLLGLDNNKSIQINPSPTCNERIETSCTIGQDFQETCTARTVCNSNEEF
jgi:hypothetical protein